MSTAPLPRRGFLADSGRALAAGWLTLQLPWLGAMAGCARGDAAHGAPFTTLTAAEGRAMRAFAAQIIPSDAELPGAEEAGAAYFVDRALALPMYDDLLPRIRAGLAALDARARAHGAADGFAALADDDQIALMREVEHGEFFAAARFLVVAGTFADPSYGGNRGGAGWHLVGIEHRPSFQAPFGWYDGPGRDASPRGAEPVT